MFSNFDVVSTNKLWSVVVVEDAVISPDFSGLFCKVGLKFYLIIFLRIDLEISSQ